MLPSTKEAQGMEVLLAHNDPEASFFNNVMHIQQHRRIRAIKRLADAVEAGKISSWAISQYLLPLLEHCVFNQSHADAHIEAQEALLAIAVSSQRLSWKQYYTMLLRYISFISSKPEMEKTIVRLLSHTLDSFVKATRDHQLGAEALLSSARGSDIPAQLAHLSPLASTLPTEDLIEPIVAGKLLPPLREYLRHKEDSVVSQRVPIALSAVKLLKVFSGTKLQIHLPPILIDVCNILRSRDQGSRDLTRKTLAEICQILGAEHFSFVLKSLKTSLLRGYQVHVLSYTVHSILLALDTDLSAGSLDSVSGQTMDIIMEDNFGTAGKEKDAEEYISKMKEVKSSKSADTLEIMARHVSANAVHNLIAPIQALLAERMTLGTVSKADELLRRLSVGITRNGDITGPQALQLSYEIIQSSYRHQLADQELLANRQIKLKRYLINVRGVKDGSAQSVSSAYDWKVTRFAFELLRGTLNKYEELQTSSRLHGFISVLGDGLLSPHEEIQTSAMRVLTTIVRVQLPAIDEHCRAFMDQAVRIFQAASTTNSELAQGALKLVAAILREKQDVPIKDTSIAYLLKRMKPDLQEPDRQGLTFNFLRAVISRKVVIPEVYEIMDVVAEIMITNQTRTVRDLARGAYFQFMMDYPQAKERFKKQTLFLVQNLSYKYQEGRQSVLEAINLLITKVIPSLVQDLIASAFVPLVLMLANDEAAQCREMAAKLIRVVYLRSDGKTLDRLRAVQQAWLAQDDQPLLVRVAIQCYTIQLDLPESITEEEVAILHARLARVLADAEASDKVPEWELIYFVLQAFVKIGEVRPELAFNNSSLSIWTATQSCLAFPHAWVKTTAAKLVNQLLSHLIEGDVTERGLEDLVLRTAHVDETTLDQSSLQRINQFSLNSLANNTLSESLAAETIKNLVILGRYFASSESQEESDRHDIPVPGDLQTQSEEDEWGGFDVQEDSMAEAYPSPPSDAVADEDLEVSGEDGGRPEVTTMISTLLGRLSSIFRAPNPKCKPLIPHLSAISVLMQLIPQLEPSILVPSLHPLLLSIHNIVDPSVPQQSYVNPTLQSQSKQLQDGAEELLTIIRSKIGTEMFARAYQGVKTGVKGKREAGRRDRLLRRERSPEGADRRKRVKRAREGEKRREKGRVRGGLRRGY